jgi:hypothetical protein
MMEWNFYESILYAVLFLISCCAFGLIFVVSNRVVYIPLGISQQRTNYIPRTTGTEKNERNYDCIILGSDNVTNIGISDEIKSFLKKERGKLFIWIRCFFGTILVFRKKGEVYLPITWNNVNIYNMVPIHESLYYSNMSVLLLAKSKCKLLLIKLWLSFKMELIIRRKTLDNGIVDIGADLDTYLFSIERFCIQRNLRSC